MRPPLIADPLLLRGRAAGPSRRSFVISTCAALGAAAWTPARAEGLTVTFNGRMGERALLVIGGQARVVATGQTVAGVTLQSMTAEEAHVLVNGRALTLRNGTPVSVGNGDGGGGGGTGEEIVLPEGPGGHYFAMGQVNHVTINFLVDTGATLVAIGTQDAERMGLDYRTAPRVPMGTANGMSYAYRVLLNSVRVGDVELHQVPGVVQPGMDGMALLGNSFLSHFDLQRKGHTLRLTRKD